jgi:hypothetical protein
MNKSEKRKRIFTNREWDDNLSWEGIEIDSRGVLWWTGEDYSMVFAEILNKPICREFIDKGLFHELHKYIKENKNEFEACIMGFDFPIQVDLVEEMFVEHGRSFDRSRFDKLIIDPYNHVFER